MKFAIALQPEVDEKWHLARQMGLEHAVGVSQPGAAGALWDYATCVRTKKLYEDFGFDLSVIEGWLPMENIKRATPEREAELERVLQAIRNIGALEIPVLCYNWMAFFGWFRTSVTTRARGGALTSSYDHRLTEAAPEAQGLRITEEELWARPSHGSCERVDPGRREGRRQARDASRRPAAAPGDGRAAASAASRRFERGLSLVESEANGICFCQGNFSAMGVDMPETINLFGAKNADPLRPFPRRARHRRQLRRDLPRRGPDRHVRGMRAYRDIGFDGAMRPDHAPAMYGDPNTHPGYEARGRLFAIGYMKGLLEGVDAMRAQRNTS